MTKRKMPVDQELKALAIARANEVALRYQLDFYHIASGPWVRFFAYCEADSLHPVVSVNARGWKATSDAFVAAATKWYQERGTE